MKTKPLQMPTAEIVDDIKRLMGMCPKSEVEFIVHAVSVYEQNEKIIKVLTRLLEKATGWTLGKIAQAIIKAGAL